MKRRWLSLLLATVMLLSLLPLQVMAEDETLVLVRENFGTDYTFESGKVYRICLNADDSYIVVEKGATLTVEPGAIIEFGVNGNVHGSGDRNRGDRLYVRGALKLLGTAENPVIVRPQYTGDWANCTGIVLERDETGGEVSLEATYCSFTGGGMEGRGWMGGIISIHGWGEMEQSYSLKLDHCALQGSSHPWEYPDNYNSPDGTYALGFDPNFYGAGICVSASGNPVDVELNDCTFGAEDAPIGAAIIDSDYANAAAHHWRIKDCSFRNNRACSYKAHAKRAVVSVDAPVEFVMTGCTFEPSEALPIPVYFNKNLSFTALRGEGEYKIENCEMSFTADESNYTDVWYGVGYQRLPVCYSGVPLRELNAKDGVLQVGEITGEGMWGYAGFDLCIADGGSISVAEGASFEPTDANDYVYLRMHLGKGATVNGIDLYESDGATKITCPTTEPMFFIYKGKYYAGEPYAMLPCEKWVRAEEPKTPVTGVTVAEGDELWLTAGTDQWSVLHAFTEPADASDPATYWITRNEAHYTAEHVWDSASKMYQPCTLRVRGSGSDDATFVAYSRENALYKTVLVHFRTPDDPEMTSVTGVSLEEEAVVLPVGGSLQLNATVAPANATTKNVWWESGDEDVVRVDQNGNITALAEGTATVSVTTLDCPTTAECTVTVTKNDTPANDYFGLWMCDADHTPNVGGGVTILYELDDGTFPPDSGKYWTSSTNQTVPKGTKVTLIAAPEQKYAFKGWYPANIDRAGPEDPFYIEGKLISTEMEYTFVGNPIGEGEPPYICAVFKYTGIERQGDQIQIWVGNTDGRATDSSGMGGKVAVRYTPSEPNVYGIKAKDGTDFVAGEIVQFYKGDEITAYAKPDEGYKFVGWYHVNIEWGPGRGKSYEGEIISSADSFTYKPGETVVPGDTEPLRYVCAVFEEDGQPGGGNPFKDVAEDAYYYDPVLWAVGHDPQITNGTSATTFSPNAACTRGQVVTFLWRAKGCPEPKNPDNPFKDVAPTDYYYKAVLWAKENGVTTGTSADKFSPNDPCTRAHVVTFLWRAEGEPAPKSTANPFNDVAEGQYYTTAVLWAVSHEPQITNGTGATTFSPGATCTRGQIVTFLYRAMAK